MASKFNSEFNYRYQVIGDTPWEKIKTLQGFLEGRVRAAALEEVGNLKNQAKVSKLKHLQNGGNGLEHEILELKAEILEAVSHQATEKEAFELNTKEIEIIKKLLKELYVIAEPTRIKGYSDEEMWEANQANEFTDANSFNTMKSNAVRHATSEGSATFKNEAEFFSSGTSNKWEQYLSAKDIENYNRRIAQLLPAKDVTWLEWGNTKTSVA
jgi:hypothetical protein